MLNPTYAIKISLLHTINDNRIWPSFIDTSSVEEKILITSFEMDELGSSGAIILDEKVNVVTYKRKTVQNVLTEIAGLLVLLRVFTFILGAFHEKRFISKMKK